MKKLQKKVINGTMGYEGQTGVCLLLIIMSVWLLITLKGTRQYI